MTAVRGRARGRATMLLLRAGLLQKLDHFILAVLRGEGEGGAAVLVLGVHVGAALDEELTVWARPLLAAAMRAVKPLSFARWVWRLLQQIHATGTRP